MKQGIFDIDKGTPIVFTYGLLKPDMNDYTKFGILGAEPGGYERFKRDVVKYESSRQEWEVKNASEFSNRPKGLSTMRISIIKGQQVQFTETQPPESGKRGKCKIVKIL